MAQMTSIFYFDPYLGAMIQFDEHIFQMGWFNHQLVRLVTLPETNIFAPENHNFWKMNFLLGWPISRCYVSFMECRSSLREFFSFQGFVYICIL